MEDNYRHKGLRRRLIEEIASKGVNNPEVLAAIEKIPRHLFLDNAFVEFAYQDKAFPIGAGQTISQPYTVGFQTQLLNLKKGEKVLEIGTGSGFQTGVLCELGVKVFSIERQKELYQKTSLFLIKLGYKRVKTFFGDGYLGLPAFAPFDKILITCGAPFVPEKLLEQLKVGGRLVVPVGAGDVQIMTSVDKLENNKYKFQEYGEFKFVPMLSSKE